MRPGIAVIPLLLVLGGCRCPSRPHTDPSNTDCDRGDGIIRVAISAQPNTLDWNRSSETSYVNYPVIHAMMRGLTRLDAHNAPAPDLAERWDVSLSDGHQVLVFHLRPGLVWSDGVTPLVAQDFVFGWKRALGVGFETAELSDLLGAGEVRKARDANDPARLAEALAHVGVEALDDLTLRVTLVTPRSYFLSRIATVYPFFPAPSRLLEGRSEEQLHAYFDQPTASSPVVLGAFRVAGWDRTADGAPLRLEPNPFGPGAADPGVPKAIVVLQSSLGQLLYDRCEVDFLYLDEPSALRRTSGFSRRELLSVYWLGLNSSMLDLRLRRAISMALDRPRLVEGLLPAARPAFGLLPDDLPGAVHDGDPRAADFPRFDLARAKALVAESGYDGRTLPLLVRTTGSFMPEVAIADGVRRQLRDIGVNVSLVTSADFANDIKDPDDRIRYPLFLRRTGADYAHPQTFFTAFAPRGINYTGFEAIDGGAAVNEFQALVEEGAAQLDAEAATAEFTRAQHLLLVEHAVLVPIYYPDRYFRTRPWIEGLGVDPFNFITLRDARIRRRP